MLTSNICKIIKKPTILFAALLITQSCSSLKESPTVYFSNFSNLPISNIECNWNKKYLLTLSELKPGDSRGQSFYIKRNSDFFGEVYISWYNDKGIKIIKTFELRPKSMPSISDPESYNYVQFYISQDEYDVTTNDSPNLSDKSTKMDRMMLRFSKEYQKNVAQGVVAYSCANNMSGCVGSTIGNAALIRVQDKEE